MIIVEYYSFLTAIVFILGWLFVWLVASGSEETMVYSEKDFFHYRTLTNKDIVNAAACSGRLLFEAHPGDGYAPSNSIFFKEATGAAPLRTYL